MPDKKYGWRIAGFIFKGICTLFILGVIGLLAWRIIDRAVDPKVIKTILPNEALCEAYDSYGDKLTLYYQEQNEYTQEEKNYGYFATCNSLIIEEAKQVQFTLRYNNSTLEYTAEDHLLTDIPTREDNVYDVTLLLMYDLTPENEEDNDGKTPEAVRYVRIQPTGEQFSHQKTLYNYRKFIFDGIEFSDDLLAIYADIYYVEDVDYEEEPYGTLLLYYYEDENLTYKLSGADKKTLTEYKE